MSLEQTYTIFRTEKMRRRQPDGSSKPFEHVSRYPGYGRCPHKALDDIMEEIAEDEDDELAETPMDDPDYDHVQQRAIDSLTGIWEVFAGTLTERPSAEPLARG